jgi:hypothetical protein
MDVGVVISRVETGAGAKNCEDRDGETEGQDQP